MSPLRGLDIKFCLSLGFLAGRFLGMPYAASQAPERPGWVTEGHFWWSQFESSIGVAATLAHLNSRVI